MRRERKARLLASFLLAYVATSFGEALLPAATFQRVGQISPDVTDVLMLGRINITSIVVDLKQVHGAQVWITEAVERLPRHHRRERDLLRQHLDAIQHEGKVLLKRAEQLESMLVANPKLDQTQIRSRRKPRSVLLAVGALALVGASVGNLMYSSYLHTRIQELEARQNGILRYIDVTASLAGDNQRRISTLNSTLQMLARHEYRFETVVKEELEEIERAQKLLMLVGVCETALANAANGLSRMVEAFMHASQGRVHMDLIPPSLVRQELRNIKERFDTGLELALEFTDLQSFYRLPCHLVCRGDEYVVAVAIPVYSSAESYELLRHIPAPVAVGDGLEMFIEGRGEFLAVNRERTLHREMDAADLQSCVVVRAIHLCPHARTFKKNSQPSCLFELLRGNLELAQRTCSHSFRLNSQTDIVQLSQDHFMVIASARAQVAQTCEDASQSKEIVLAKGTTRLRLPEGCSLSAAGAYVAPARNYSFSIDVNTMDVGMGETLNLRRLLNEVYPHLDLDPKEIATITKSLAVAGASVTISDVMAARRLIPKIGHHISFAALATAGAVLLLGILFVCWICCQWRKKSKEPAPVTSSRRRKHVDVSQILVAETAIK